MFRRFSVALAGVLACGLALHAQDTPRIWQGVYTTTQAARGKAVFDEACIRCHGGDLAGTTAPALKGDRFFTTWGGDTIESLFVKIRDTMPPNVTSTLDSQAKLDIVAYILQANEFPTGSSELVAGSTDIASAQILRKGETAGIQNFSLVQTVGCLTGGPGETWLLTRSADPVRTRQDKPEADGVAAAASRPLGSRTYRLISVTPFRPQATAGQKVEARGLVYTEPGDERINLTSLTPTGVGCS